MLCCVYTSHTVPLTSCGVSQIDFEEDQQWQIADPTLCRLFRTTEGHTDSLPKFVCV